MADTEQISEALRPLSVKLAHITLGGRSVRYITVSPTYKNFSVKEKLSSTVGLHLFMAADVLTGTNSLAKNNCRIHQRFAKEGFASKLLFTDCRLNGIANSGNVWFYSIQGVFKSVFEYQTSDVQRDCLLKLRDLWLRSYPDERIPETMSLALNDSGLSSSGLSDRELQEKLNAFQARISTTLFHKDLEESSLSRLAVEQCLHHVIELHTRYPTETGLTVVTQVLEFLKLELDFYNESPSNCFPFDLFSAYRSSLEDTTLKNELMICDFNIPVRKHFALCAVADWLGKEFHSLERTIATRVEAFKEDHINCIDNLPPAESIVTALFPCAMKRLLSKWTGLSRLQNADCLNQDHNYSPPEKKTRKDLEQTRNLFPLIQLILEFANNALVSGTAHVVFSRLRYAV